MSKIDRRTFLKSLPLLGLLPCVPTKEGSAEIKDVERSIIDSIKFGKIRTMIKSEIRRA
jgi:hypothetical protein